MSSANVTPGTFADAELAVGQFNRTHGLRRTKADSVTLIRIALSGLAHLDDDAFKARYPEGWTLNTLVDLTGLTNAYVSRLLDSTLDEVRTVRTLLDSRRNKAGAAASEGKRDAANKRQKAQEKADAEAAAKAEAEADAEAAAEAAATLNAIEPRSHRFRGSPGQTSDGYTGGNRTIARPCTGRYATHDERPRRSLAVAF